MNLFEHSRQGQIRPEAPLAARMRPHFETISAVLAGVADLRRIIKEAR